MSELKGAPYCIKYLLFVFNFVFWLLGVTVMAIGIWVIADLHTENLVKSTGFEYYYTSCYIVIVTGALIMIIGILGCVGALQENPCLISSHVIFLIIIFILELSAAAYVFSIGVEGTSLDNFIQSTLEKFIDESGHNDQARQSLKTVQTYLQCCGVRNWLDYETYNKAVPDSCRNEITGRQFEMGCLERITLFIEEKTGLIGGLSLAICLIQILGITFSLILCQAVIRNDSR